MPRKWSGSFGQIKSLLSMDRGDRNDGVGSWWKAEGINNAGRLPEAHM